MDEGAAVGAAAVETDVLDNVQGAEDSRKHAFGNESLAQQVANHKIQLRVIQNFADFGNRRVGQVDQRIFKKLQIAHANGADDQSRRQSVGCVQLMHQLFNLLVGAVFFGNFQRCLFFDLFNDVGGDVVRQVMRNNQVALQLFGKGVDDFFSSKMHGCIERIAEYG